MKSTKSKWYKTPITVFLSIALIITMIPSVPWEVPASAASIGGESSPITNAKASPDYDPQLRMWYEKPATITSNGPNSNNNANQWIRETLPIGNGYTGTLVFGGIEKERLHFNDKTLWDGGPSTSNPTGDYAFIGARTTASAISAERLLDFRTALDDKSAKVFGLDRVDPPNGVINWDSDRYWFDQLMFAPLTGYGGSGTGFAYYQDFGDIYFDLAPSGVNSSNVTNYVRDLDMNTAVASVNYTYGGVDYTREYFSSYPDNVQAGRLTASESGKITFNANLATWHRGPSTTFSAIGDTITMKGVAGAVGNGTDPTVATQRAHGLHFEAQLKLIPQGGTMTANSDGTISIIGADTVDFVFTSGTNYKNEFPTYRGPEPHDAVTQLINSAAAKGYINLLQGHLADYQSIFKRVSIDFGEPVQNIPTDKLIQNYRAGKYTRAAEEMSFQFGRYLMIAGSRDNALPLNLQGAWGIGRFAWYGDYHFNINLQMNYWPTMSGNMAECMPSLVDYVDSLREPGHIVAERNNNASGFIVNCFSNIFGYTAGNTGNQSAGNNPAGAAWILQNIYDYYRFTGDKTYLRDKIYPIMKDVEAFWEDYLWFSPSQQRYVVAPSVSPEQGPTVNGATYDQSLVWQFYKELIDAANELGVDQNKISHWSYIMRNLEPVQIGNDGQIKEWFEETSISKAKAGSLAEIDIPAWKRGLAVDETAHRHASHLVGLYPGTLINKDNTQYMNAAKVSLTERTLEGTGWSKAHKINLWARTLDGNKSYALVQSMLKGGNAGILENLLDSHGGGGGGASGIPSYTGYPIFQIDGNFGLTSGMIEMLLQSQLGYTQFLPAIPQEWNNGHVKGLVSRGNFVVDMDWSDGNADLFSITSRDGGTFTGEYQGLGSAIVREKGGALINVTKLSDDKISFATTAGKTYVITPTANANQKLVDIISGAKDVSSSMTSVQLAVLKSGLDASITSAETAKNAGNVEEYQAPYTALRTMLVNVLDSMVKSNATVFNNIASDNPYYAGLAASFTTAYNIASKEAASGMDTQNENVINAAKGIAKAISALVYIKDLKTSVTVADALDVNDYDSDTLINVFTNSLSGAKSVLSNEASAQNTVDAAKSTLDTAVVNMKATLKNWSYLNGIVQAAEKAEDNISAGKYLPINVPGFMDALDAAKLVQSKPSTKQKEIDAVAAKLLNTLGKLVTADKNNLLETVNTATSLYDRNLANLLTSSDMRWFGSTYEAATSVLYDANATQSQINTAINNIKTLIDELGLVVADKTALRNAVSAGEVNASNYSDHDAYASYQVAFNQAKTLLNDPGTLKIEADKAISALQSAKAALDTKVKSSASLSSAIATYRGQLATLRKQFVAADVKVFENMLNSADSIAKSANATQSQYDAALDTLKNIRAMMRPVADKTVLVKTIARAEKISSNYYTKFSFDTLKQSLASAKQINSNTNLSAEDQNIINSANTQLTVAISKLVYNVTSLKLAKKPTTLKKGKTFTLKVKVAPSAIQKNVKLIYKSSNKKVATVSSAGKIKALKKGKATITIIAPNGKTLVVNLTVN